MTTREQTVGRGILADLEPQILSSEGPFVPSQSSESARRAPTEWQTWHRQTHVTSDAYLDTLAIERP